MPPATGWPPHSWRSRGFTGPEQAIEGTYGFAKVMSDEADFDADRRRARRQLGDFVERVQALPVRRRAVSGHRRLPRTARAPRGCRRSDCPRDGQGAPAVAHPHRPARCQDRSRGQGQRSAQCRGRFPLRRRRSGAICRRMRRRACGSRPSSESHGRGRCGDSGRDRLRDRRDDRRPPVRNPRHRARAGRWRDR